MAVPPPCSWGGLLGLLGGCGRQAHGSSERAPPWADDTMDHWRDGPTSTEDSTMDCRRLAVGLCRRSPLVQQATLASKGNLLTSLNAIWVAVRWPLTHAGGLCARVTSNNGPSQRRRPPAYAVGLRASVALTNLTQHRLGHRAVAAGSDRRLQHACRIGRSFSSKSGSPRGGRQPTLATSVRASHQLALFITAWVAAWQLPAHAGGPCARETTPTYTAWGLPKMR